MKNLIFTCALYFLHLNSGQAQGCIIVRNINGFNHYNITDRSFTTSTWIIDATTRYFKAEKRFMGDKELIVAEHDREVNQTFTTDFTANRILSKGWSLALNLPIISNSRTTTKEHGGDGTPRYTTHSFGIGDTRLTVYKWILKPAQQQKINIQFGLGIKLPTGDYQYQDYFHRNDSTKILAPVNPSIQLGDGGTGITTELTGFYVFDRTLSMYANFYYLINPREQNGVSRMVGRTPTRNDLLSGNTVNSVMDQYTVRTGLNLVYNKFSFSGGLRLEGIPVYDLIGGSNGNRRVGYNLSAEPGLIYNMKKTSLYYFMPIMIKRKTKQSLADKKMSQLSGEYILTPGSFADYLIYTGVSIKL